MTLLLACSVLSLVLVLDAVLNVKTPTRRTLSRPLGDAIERRRRLRVVMGGGGSR